MSHPGILFAVIALLSWTFGDFFIQRSTRRVGNITSLLAIGLLGFLILTPIVWNDLSAVFANRASLGILGLALGITFVAAVLDFEGLRVGKLSVIEPVMSLELPFTIFIGLSLLGERVSGWQTMLIVGVFTGLLFTVIRHEPHHWWKRWLRRHWLEKGVWLAAAGAVAMALTNIYTGLASQSTSPLVAIWFIHTGLAGACLLILAFRQGLRQAWTRVRAAWRTVLTESILDNTAWLAYSAAVVFLPISITIAVTESYIAFAALLGVLLNRERLQLHQKYGVVLTLASAIVLAVISG